MCEAHQNPKFQAPEIGKDRSRTSNLSLQCFPAPSSMPTPHHCLKALDGLALPSCCPHLPLFLTYQALAPLASLPFLELTELFPTSFPHAIPSAWKTVPPEISIWLAPSPHSAQMSPPLRLLLTSVSKIAPHHYPLSSFYLPSLHPPLSTWYCIYLFMVWLSH